MLLFLPHEDPWVKLCHEWATGLVQVLLYSTLLQDHTSPTDCGFPSGNRHIGWRIEANFLGGLSHFHRSSRCRSRDTWGRSHRTCRGPPSDRRWRYPCCWLRLLIWSWRCRRKGGTISNQNFPQRKQDDKLFSHLGGVVEGGGVGAVVQVEVGLGQIIGEWNSC